MEDVYDTQRLFRSLMQAMAKPGRPVRCDGPADMPLSHQICRALMDRAVTFAVVGTAVRDATIETLSLLTGSRAVAVEDADFIVVAGGDSDGALAYARTGTLEYPDQGATVVYPVPGLRGGANGGPRLSGPGIDGHLTVTGAEIRAGEWNVIRAVNASFPLGIDVLFCDEREAMGLPRSTAIRWQEEE